MAKSFNLNKICALLLVASLMMAVAAMKREKKEPPKTIVQANHYSSTTEKRANYDIRNITIGKPLILILKNEQRKSKYVTDFEISLTLGSETSSCDFKKVTDLCIIPNTTSADLNMIIQCHTLPCEVSWIFYQPEAKAPSGNQIALNLFSLQDSIQHLIGEITCNDPAITTLDGDVIIYSNAPYRRMYRNNILYVLFNNEKKGYVFIDIQEKSRACSQVAFKQPTDTLKVGGNSTTDFVVKESSVEYWLAEVPKTDFRLQCATVRLDSFKELKSTMLVKLLGTNGGVEKQILQHQLTVSDRKSNSFTMAFKKVEGYEKLKVTFEVQNNQVVLLETRFVEGDTHLVELGETIFFTLKKGDAMSFQIVKDEEAEEKQSSFIVPKRKTQLTLSKASCPLKETCQFSINATEDTQNMIYISSREMNSTYIDQAGQGLYEFQEIQFLPITKKAQHKIRVGDNVFFKKSLKKDQFIQVHVNSPNVIMYAASKNKCEVPDERCRERTGNFHHPFAYKAEEDCELLINVQGLDNTQFELSIIQQQNFLLLEDGMPFSYTMDKHEDRIGFKVKLKEKSDVSFNLVAPLNTLKLMVANAKDDLPDPDSAQQSTDGYIFIEKSDIKGLNFVISVMKIKESAEFFTHFTIIVSSKNNKVRLDPSVTSYETLAPAAYRDYVFEFDPTQAYILSFYAYNLKEKEVKIEIKVSDQEKKWDSVKAMVIDKESDYLDLREISMTLCEQQGVISCEIFLRVTNKMDVEIDISVTLLMRNAIVELKDGVWQAFPQNLLTSTTNFYFYPRHADKSIYVSYHSMVQELRVAYRLWKYDADTLNPAEWPFPKEVDEQQQLHANFKQNNYIMIDHEKVKAICWPTCILLISFYVDYDTISKSELSVLQNSNNYMNFKIMASNNHIELPQKQKMSLTLAKDEEKLILVDLKYILDKEQLTFFTSTSIGFCTFKADVYSQQKPQCPSALSQSDFSFFLGESSLSVADITAKLKEKGMEEDNNKYLCLAVHSQESCKMSIEYIADSNGFKVIAMDTTEEIVLDKGEAKYYQTDGMYSQSAKITRLSGFPFISIKKCTKREEYLKCMQDFQKDEDKGKQIVVKTESFAEQACPNCIFLFKFSTVQPSKVNFHLALPHSQIELKEGVILSDFLNEEQTTQYNMFTDAKEDVIINIHVQEGDIQASVTNGNQINLNKKSDPKNRVLHFVIKAQEPQGLQKADGMINPMALTEFMSSYHVKIKSLNASKAATYTISYSSGKRELYLQDGLILDYILEPNKPSTFYYYNELASNHIYYSLSAESGADLQKIKIKTYYLEDPNDQSTKKEVEVEKPAMSRKTPNPTVLFSLPNQNFFIFELKNPTDKEKRVSMGINHQQVILLPFNHEFPFQLHKKEELNILVDVNIPGFLELSIRKCDRSEPSFAYSFDYDGFIKQEFMYDSKLNEQPYFHYTIKAKRIGTLYLNFQADPDEDSTLSVKLIHTEQKSKDTRMKPGKKGVISYELEQQSAKVSVPVAQCGDEPCKGVKYYFLSSKNEQIVYSQLVCSSSFFSTAGFTSAAPLQLTKIDGSINNKTLAFDFPVRQSVFLGVKGVGENGQEVFYQPIEIASLWEKWGKVSTYDKILMLFIVLLCLCVCLVFVRKASRRGYKPLDESQE